MSLIKHKNSHSFRGVLLVAGVYHLLWGLSVILFPSFFFTLSAAALPSHIELWQAVGLYTAVLGLGYLLATGDPIRNWHIVFIGFTAKFCIVIWYLVSLWIHQENSVLFTMLFVNHVVWLLPFLWILYNVYKYPYLLDNEMIRMNQFAVDELLDMFTTNKGESLAEMSMRQPVMLVFLRHFGCTFCKETIMNIRENKDAIRGKGTAIVFVNMLSEKEGMRILQEYQMDDSVYVSDPEALLYKAFNLRRGTLSQLLGPAVLLRGIYLWFTKKAFTTYKSGADVYQMPGIFLLYQGVVIKQFVHETVADNPPYLELATCEQCMPAL